MEKKKKEKEGPVAPWEFCLHLPGNCLAPTLWELGCGRRSDWGRGQRPPLSLPSAVGLPGTWQAGG